MLETKNILKIKNTLRIKQRCGGRGCRVYTLPKDGEVKINKMLAYAA